MSKITFKNIFGGILIIIVIPLIFFAIFKTNSFYFHLNKVINGNSISVAGYNYTLSKNFAIMNVNDDEYFLQDKELGAIQGNVFIYDARIFLNNAGLDFSSLKSNCQLFEIKDEHPLYGIDKATYLIVDKRLALVINSKPEERIYNYYCKEVFEPKAL